MSYFLIHSAGAICINFPLQCWQQHSSTQVTSRQGFPQTLPRRLGLGSRTNLEWEELRVISDQNPQNLHSMRSSHRSKIPVKVTLTSAKLALCFLQHVQYVCIEKEGLETLNHLAWKNAMKLKPHVCQYNCNQLTPALTLIAACSSVNLSLGSNKCCWLSSQSSEITTWQLQLDFDWSSSNVVQMF